MATLLSDHDCEGQTKSILHAMRRLGYIELLELDVIFFATLDLPIDATDKEIWQFCQKHNFYLLTGNRTRKAKEESMQAVLDKLATAASLPVITIGNPNRVTKDRDYCDACAEAIAQIILNAELYVGVPRLYIP